MMAGVLLALAVVAVLSFTIAGIMIGLTMGTSEQMARATWWLAPAVLGGATAIVGLYTMTVARVVAWLLR